MTTHSLAIAVAALALLSTGPVSGDPKPARPAPAKALPWLDVKLPAPPARGPTGEADLVLDGDHADGPDYAGIRLTIGKAAPRLVPLGRREKVVVAASATAPLHLEIAGVRMLAHVHPGDDLALRSGHDGGWVATIGNRMPEVAAKELTICGDKTCPDGYHSTNAYKGDAVCPVPPDEQLTRKCVKAPTVRARGPVSGRTELHDNDLRPLTTQPLAAGAFGPWLAMEYNDEQMPRIQLGDAEAYLIVGAGDACEVWLDHGRVESRSLPAK